MASGQIDRMSLALFARRSPWLSASYLAADLAIYVGFVYGALAVEAVWLKLVFSFGAGTMISLAAIAGHDAGHQSFSASKTVNRIAGTLAFLPALHPFALWEHHHNRVHHRFTAQIGIDNAFSPMTVQQYRAASPARRAYYRFLRSIPGQPLFYLIDIWPPIIVPFLNKDMPMTPRVWFDLTLVYVYFAAFMSACFWVALNTSAGGDWWFAGIDAFVFAFAIPFLVWNAFISFLSIVQHTGTDVRWVMPTGLPSTAEQASAGTVHAVLPEWLDRLFHRIMQHQAHHLHVGIPLQRLKAAQAAFEQLNGGRLVHVWTPAYHWRLTRECQLYDPVYDRWRRFSDVDLGDTATDLAA